MIACLQQQSYSEVFSKCLADKIILAVFAVFEIINTFIGIGVKEGLKLSYDI